MSATDGIIIRPNVTPEPESRRQAAEERTLGQQARNRRSRLGRLARAAGIRQATQDRRRLQAATSRDPRGFRIPPTRTAARAGAAVRAGRLFNPVTFAVAFVAAVGVAATRAITGQNVDQLAARANEAIFGGLNEEAKAKLATRRRLGADPRTLVEIQRAGGVSAGLARVGEAIADDERNRARGRELFELEFSAPTTFDLLLDRLESLFRDVQSDPRFERTRLNILNDIALGRATRFKPGGRAAFNNETAAMQLRRLLDGKPGR